MNHRRIARFVGSIFAVTSRAEHVGRNYFLLFNTQRAGHSGAPEAAVPVGDLAQVLLVVILCVVESLSLPDVGGDRAKAVL